MSQPAGEPPHLVVGGLDGSTVRAMKVDSSGRVETTAVVQTGDIEIGAVEIKNDTTDDRAKVQSSAVAGTEMGLVTRNIPGGTQPVSAASLPLPTGAATEATLASIKDTDGVKKITDPLPAGTNLLGRAATDAQTGNGCTPFKRISTLGTNAENVKSSAGNLYAALVSNTNAVARYLKLYDKATAPTVGTDTPVWTCLIPPNSAGFTISIPPGLSFTLGIGIGITTGVADADTGAVAADEIVVNLAYK
jgi:hypothetical protein